MTGRGATGGGTHQGPGEEFTSERDVQDWLRRRMDDAADAVEPVPDVAEVHERRRRDRRGRRRRVMVVGAFAVTAAVVVLAWPSGSTRLSSRPDRSATPASPDATPVRPPTWEVTTRGRLTVTVRRTPRPGTKGRLTAAEMISGLVPIPGLDEGCTIGGIVSVTVTGPDGIPWNGVYSDYDGRVVTYTSFSGFPAQVIDVGRPYPAMTEIWVVTGLGDGDRISIPGVPDASLTSATANGVAVLARDAVVPAAQMGEPPELLAPQRTSDGRTTALADPILDTESNSDALEPDPLLRAVRDPRCAGMDGAYSGYTDHPGDDADRAVMSDVAASAQRDIRAGRLPAYDPRLGIPALGDTVAEVEAVLEDAKVRALASPLRDQLPQATLAVEKVYRTGNGVLLGMVTLSATSGSGLLSVDVHREDTADGVRWFVSPQTICGALRAVGASCVPAP